MTSDISVSRLLHHEGHKEHDGVVFASHGQLYVFVFLVFFVLKEILHFVDQRTVDIAFSATLRSRNPLPIVAFFGFRFERPPPAASDTAIRAMVSQVGRKQNRVPGDEFEYFFEPIVANTYRMPHQRLRTSCAHVMDIEWQPHYAGAAARRGKAGAATTWGMWRRVNALSPIRA